MKLETMRQTEIPNDLAGKRLDQALSVLFPEYSRNRLQEWIRSGHARLNGEIVTAKHKVFGGEEVTLIAEPTILTQVAAEAIPLDIVFEDETVLILNKPPGLVVHPAAGHWDGTLQNALLSYCPALETVPRSGIVHRIDKDTSGLLMVAKTLEAHKHLVDQLQDRSVRRAYLALVHGAMTGGGTVNEPIGRHGNDRKRFAVRPDGKPAVTHYRIAERFKVHTLVEVRLETGRTHQIRVHLAHIHYPLVGDPVYGGRARIPAGASPETLATLKAFKRQALHAQALGIIHPDSRDYMEWEAPIPADFNKVLLALREEEAPP
jgi:23S rRNA pseudouridine1911/1915/1917 synthase